MKVYCGKEVSNILNVGNVGNVGSNIVMELAEPYLDNGRTIFVDNWYSSVELAELLQSRNTYLVGTLRCNRKSNPKEVTKKKLKRGGNCISEKLIQCVGAEVAGQTGFSYDFF